jgi:hypothetical protein
MNLTTSSQSKIMSIELRVNVSVGVVAGDVVGQLFTAIGAVVGQ